MKGEPLHKMLERHEDYRKHPYKCTAGRWTIGIGRNISDKGISYGEAREMLDNDIYEVDEDLIFIFGVDFMDDLKWEDEERWKALVDMRFQLGYGGFRSFKKMIAAIKEGEWEKAADEALDSKYAKVDTPERAKEIAEMLRNGG